MGCGGNGDRIYRHDSIHDALYSAAQSTALAPWKELPSLIPGTRSRQADIFLPNWQRGQPATLDVTVISTLQRVTLQGAASTQGHALVVGMERTLAAHVEACCATKISAYLPNIPDFPVKSRFRGLLPRNPGFRRKNPGDSVCVYARVQKEQWLTIYPLLSVLRDTDLS